jgi:hypothetical protein
MVIIVQKGAIAPCFLVRGHLLWRFMPPVGLAALTNGRSGKKNRADDTSPAKR